MQRTREQILEGLVHALSHGLAELSIPEVAREAGVSVPTVYRYFRTKRELIEALGTYTLQKLGATGRQLPQSPEDLIAGVRELSRKYDELDETLRAASLSAFAYEVRREFLPARLKMYEDALAPIAGGLNAADRARLRNVILVLCSSAVLRTFKDYLDLSGEEAGENIAWAIRVLCAQAGRSGETEGAAGEEQ